MRPDKSLIPAGRISCAALSTGNPPAKVRSATCAAFLSLSSSVGARSLPSANRSRAASASARSIGAVKRRCAGVTGLQAARPLTRLHSKLAANAARTVKSNRWSRPTGLPCRSVMAAGQTSAISCLGGSGRRHLSAMTVLSAARRAAGSLGGSSASCASLRKLCRCQSLLPRPSRIWSTAEFGSTSTAAASPIPSIAQLALAATEAGLAGTLVATRNT